MIPIQEVEKYLKRSLGYTGSQWEGCIGDKPMVDAGVGASNTSSPMESHFAAYYSAVANNQNELKPDKAILNKCLGVYANGRVTRKSTYWSTFNDLNNEEKQRYEPTDIRHRRLKAIWLLILQIDKANNEIDYIQVAEGQSDNPRFYFVKSEVPDILMASKYQKSKEDRSHTGLQQAVDTVIGSFSINDAINILRPSDIPSKKGYYTVDNVTGICYLCPAYLKSGCLRCRCKHALTVEKFANYSAESYSTEVRKLCVYLHNREKSNLPRCRNPILYNGISEDVIHHLKSGGVSSCGYRGKSIYDLDSSSFPEAPPVFIKIDLVVLLQHCQLGINEQCPAYFYVTAYKMTSSEAFLQNIGLINADGSKASGYVKAHDIFTFPEGEIGFPCETSDEGDQISLVRVLQPAETRRVRTQGFELAASRLPGTVEAESEHLEM
jgi:hypothetical protein